MDWLRTALLESIRVKSGPMGEENPAVGTTAGHKQLAEHGTTIEEDGTVKEVGKKEK